MFRFFRKHNWILIVALSVTIISFLFWNAAPGMRGNGAGGNNFGTIYGRQITADAFTQMDREFKIFYFLRYGEWPEQSQSIKSTDIERETYLRLLLVQKAKTLGIHVSEKTVALSAGERLRAMGRNGQTVSLDEFNERVLQPAGLTETDFQNFVRDDLLIQQLVETFGLSGTLVPPQEVAQLYAHENQEVSAQAIFFSASNFLARVSVTPAAVAQFYTNYLAAYRLPNRISINYLEFSASNFLAQSKAEWAKTNFTEYVNAMYLQYGGNKEFADAKTPDEAKTKIRETLIQQRALADARDAANAFATELFAIDPPKPENLLTLAGQKKLTVHKTAPFDERNGPSEFEASSDFVKKAFELNADAPYAGPLIESSNVYVFSIAQEFPSEIPSLESIRSRVAENFKEREAVELAQRTGTNFYSQVAAQIASGKTFGQAAIAAGHAPEILPPFSLSSSEVPGFDDRADIRALKQAAFTTSAGHISNFMPTDDGGFILYVQSMMPLDEEKKSATMPQFLAQVERAGENEAFNLWLNSEANREFRTVPFFQEQKNGNAPAQ